MSDKLKIKTHYQFGFPHHVILCGEQVVVRLAEKNYKLANKIKKLLKDNPDLILGEVPDTVLPSIPLPLSQVVCVPKLPDWDKFCEYDTTIEDVADAHLVTIHFYENQKVESLIVYGEKFWSPLNDKEYFKHAETELKKFGTPYFEWLDDRFIGLCVSNLKELTND